MKRSRFNEEQIIAILKEQEAGMATAEGKRVLKAAATRPGRSAAARTASSTA